MTQTETQTREQQQNLAQKLETWTAGETIVDISVDLKNYPERVCTEFPTPEFRAIYLGQGQESEEDKTPRFYFGTTGDNVGYSKGIVRVGFVSDEIDTTKNTIRVSPLPRRASLTIFHLNYFFNQRAYLKVEREFNMGREVA